MMPHRTFRPFATTALATTLAASLLAGCAQTAPHPGQTASRAQSALSGGEAVKAVVLAEQAVLADPRNPGYRMLLGSAYLRAGRFVAARQAYDDAMELGQDDGKVALSLALTDIALGHPDVALDTLGAHRQQIPVADYGLALALAGQADQAVQVLSGAVRAGDDTPKLRQNLAYAMAMAGHWREARDMAAQDVPADQLAARMAQWAQLNDPGNMRLRVASVLGVPAGLEDEGQPAALALANFPLPRSRSSRPPRRPRRKPLRLLLLPPRRRCWRSLPRRNCRRSTMARRSRKWPMPAPRRPPKSSPRSTCRRLRLLPRPLAPPRPGRSRPARR
jgi:Flp pilus assembly protein TadD